MSALLDTHAFIWFVEANNRLPRSVRERIEASEPHAISSVSVWEITNKHRLGKFPQGDLFLNRWDALIDQQGFANLHLTRHHAVLAGSLQSPHRDPFDRFLAAQSIIEGLPIITADPALAALGARTIWR